MEIPYAFDFPHAFSVSDIKEQFGDVVDTSMPFRAKPTKNQAAWIPKPKAQLEVGTAPYPVVGPDEIVIRNHAVAINPVDWKVQESGGFISKYPSILGEDVAGEVVAVGSNVTRLTKGDRVLAHALGLGSGNTKNSGFQLYPVLSDLTTAKIPKSLSYEDASVLPLSISTAATGLYLKNMLGLPVPGKGIAPVNSSILIWGGSSSVGSSAIQLAVASGLLVVTTASEPNFEYCRSLGAHLVFDYHSELIVGELVTAILGSTLVGAYDAIGLEASIIPCAKVLHELGGGKVCTVLGAPKKGIPDDVKVLQVSSGRLPNEEPETSKALYHEHVPEALADGRLKPRPKALVVGDGLESVQKGLDRQKKGVSARKVVVTL